MLRTTLAALAGVAVMTAASFAIEGVILWVVGLDTLSAARWNHPTMIVYVLLSASLGGWVAARVARARPWLAAGVTGALATGLNVVGYIDYGSQAPSWFWVAAFALVPLATVLGGGLAGPRDQPRAA